MWAHPHCILDYEMEPNGVRYTWKNWGIKKETQKSKPNPINENKLSQKVKPIHTVQDFAVCIGVAEIRK